ncbi:unnamed protein product [Pieris brassicae]|uniref:RH1 domain-containing protein n=1 Tax=Pieris brassicae TaxID=7116 RepID=A0A9P0TRU2_PIEBR|nr:unnamed protein product [Pieris brassicae]
MPDFDDEVTVVDVYDLASDIGKECEIIIEKYGPEAVTALLPKVINALELLENLAVRNEKENRALHELTAKISQLENDKIEKAEYRQRFEKEIEAIEEQWRTESAELVTAVARLQDENKRLRRTVNTPADGTSAPPSPAREHDQEVLSRLSSTAEKQRATLRHQELQLQEKQQLIDSLTNQVEKLAQVSRDLRRKHKQLQNQMRLVCEERTELSAIVQSQQRDITVLQQSDAQNKKCASCGVGFPEGTDDEDQSSKPTFSVRELRAILHERNELKLKLNRAEEQLQALQTEPQPDSSGSDTSPSLSSTIPEEDEAPVQGPLPAEPDDAPWKRNSGIRKFFRKLFAESDIAVGPFPRRARSRHSEIKHTHADLRQELTSLDLNLGEVDTWLGKFDERDDETEDFRFDHDIPLQRSVSLDRGLDIVNYLQTLGSDWSDSDASSAWSVDYGGTNSDLRLEQYRSFEDIPAPPKKKNRHVSLDVTNSPHGNSLALAVLRESYKGIEMEKHSGNVSSHVKKLQKTFSFKNFDDYKDSAKSSIENLDDEEPYMGLRMSLKNISEEQEVNEDEHKVRQRRLGVITNEWQQRSSNDLRKLVLIQQNLSHVKSCNDIVAENKKPPSRCNSTNTLQVSTFVPLGDSYENIDTANRSISNLRKLKASFSSLKRVKSRQDVPTIVVEDNSRLRKVSIEVDTKPPLYTTNIVQACNCQICCENGARKPFLGNINKVFIKVIYYMDCARKFTCWDENNLNDSEMYRCIMHLLRLLFGLWLRHCDHSPCKINVNTL